LLIPVVSMDESRSFSLLSSQEAVERLCARACRVLVIGAPGTGKSTLAARLGKTLAAHGLVVKDIGADPGTPAFGIPGAVCLGEWWDHGWHVLAMEPLCSLDAARFRLPLVGAVRRLVAQQREVHLLVDTSGVVRGAAGAELLTSLYETSDAEVVIVLVRGVEKPPLAQEVAALDAEVWLVSAEPEASRPSKRQRERSRTARWDAYLQEAQAIEIDLEKVQRLGSPPPLDVLGAWQGRQVALGDGSRWLIFGEALELKGTALTVRAPPFAGEVRRLVARDAQRDASGCLVTAAPFGGRALHWVPPRDIAPADSAQEPRPLLEIGPVTATLVNGVFGDPLLHLRLRHRRRSLLFDLGEAGRLPARMVHQVTDVFISHAHADHIGGFMWFMRSRLGDFPLCRLFGPPGLADNIEGMVRGIQWDRIGDAGPRFEVAELHGDSLVRFWIQAGRRGMQPLEGQAADGGVLLCDAEFKVRAAVLDHGTPVLAFAFEPNVQINVRKDRLAALDLTPGPWLTELKRRFAGGESAGTLTLPGGGVSSLGALAEALLITAPGKKIVYATDLADMPANRERLAWLARGAHTFFCEAPFLSEDAEQAVRTGHLTARACGEIANAADVQQLMPFHFSRRYEDTPQRVYAEVASVCSRTLVPK
jgi:ribonuclease Z